MTAIRVELQLADGSFTTGMLRAGQSLGAFQRQLIATNPQLQAISARGGDVIRTMTRMDGTTKGFLDTLRDVSIVAGLASYGLQKLTGAAHGWAGEIVRINSEMERLQHQMKAMSTAKDPMKDAADSVKYLREQAGQMPFSLKALTSGFVKLKATGTDPTNGSLKAIADGIAAFGGTDEAFTRTVLGITQAAGKGVLQMEELRQQIGESMPIAMQLLARSMGLTVGQLAKEIQTGTVAARPALEMLYKELDRAYGGTAQRMMQTFSGQMTQLHTNMQMLATSEGGKGFFDQVKGQLVDINRFLSGDMAQKMAISFGQGLSSIVQGLRTAVEMIWEFRDEITRTAILLGTGIGIMAVSRGLIGLSTVLRTSAMSWSVFRVSMNSALSDVALGASGFKSFGTAIIGARIGISGLGAALGATLVGVAGLAPLIIGLGMAAYGAAEYFGLLSDKTRDAYDELVKYGSEAAGQAEKIGAARLKQIDAEIEAERQRVVAGSDMGGTKLDASGNRVADESIGHLWTLLEERKKIAEAVPKMIMDETRRVAETDLAKFREDVSERLSESQRAYQQEQTRRDKQYEDDLAASDKTEKSKTELRKQYENDTRANMIKLSQAIMDEHDKQIKSLENMLLRASDSEKKSIQDRLSFSQEARNAAFNHKRELDTYTFGAPKTTAGGDETAAIARGVSTLDSLKREIAGLQAEFNGASSAMAEMQVRISQNDFGSIKEGGDEVRKLHEGLLEATAAKEALDKVMDGRKKADAELKNIEQQLLEKERELLELQAGGDKLNPIEKFQLALNNGLFEGLGPLENIKKAVLGVTAAQDTMGESLNQIALVAQQNAFGEATVTRVKTVTDAVRELAAQIGLVGSGLTGLNFGSLGNGMGQSITAAITGSITPVLQNLPGQVTDRMAQAMDHLMKKGWSQTAAAGIVGNLVAESNMNPNAVGDNGNAFGLAQWNDRGPAMKSWLAEQGKAWNDFFGQLDFVDHELKGSEAKAGNKLRLARDEKAAAEIVMNDYERPALWARRESGGKRAGAAQQAYNLAGGGAPLAPPVAAPAAPAMLAPLPTYDVTASTERQNALLDGQIDKTAELNAAANDLKTRWDKVTEGLDGVKRQKALEELKKQTAAAGEEADGADKHYRAMIKTIASGALGTNTDPNSAVYKELLEAAKERDRVEADVADKKKLSNDVDRQSKKLEEDRLELNRRIAEEAKKAADPSYKPDSSAFQNMKTDLDAYVESVKRLHGEGSAAHKKAISDSAAALQQQKQLDVLTTQSAIAQETQTIQTGLLTQSQARQQAMQQKLAEIDQWAAKAREAGMSEVEITRQTEEAKAAIRAQYAAQSDPMTKQMQEWGDLQGQLTQMSTKWMDSIAGGITDLIMGTGDLRSVIQGILKDLVNMGVKYLMSGMMGGKNGQAPGAKGAKGATGAKGGQMAAAGKGKLAPGLFHTGGIIGSGAARPTKIATAAMFAGAPKFHTGGIVDSLLPSEVPIIAKKGEGVFTPDQMEAMGGFQQTQAFQINAPITVNGSAGSPEQNTDLAGKMAKQMEQSMRGVVADEIRKQTRPGNFMNTRSR